MKTCSKCGSEKSFDSYYKDKYAADGYRSLCKACSYQARPKKEKKPKPKKIKTTPRPRPVQKTDEQRIAKMERLLEASLVQQTGLKHCNICSRLLRIDQFQKRPKNLDGVSKTCKRCLKRKKLPPITPSEQDIVSRWDTHQSKLLEAIKKRKEKL